MADVKALKGQRAQIKGAVTRIENFFNTAANPTAEEAKVRLEKLEDLYKKFDEIQIKLETRRENDDNAFAEDQADGEAQRTVFENCYYQTAARAREIINAETRRIAHAERAAEVLEARAANVAAPGLAYQDYERNRAKPKLPVIKLPEFKGDFTKWMFFKNSFETTIHQDEDLTAMQKHQYLVGVLQGEARQVIQGFTISGENYESAWQLLKDTYDNQIMILETHLDELLKFPAITKENKADSMRQFIWHIQTHVKSLQALRQPVEQWETIIIHLAKKHLDFAEQRDWQAATKDKTPLNMPTLEEFTKFLTERSHMIRVLQQTKEKPTSQKSSSTQKKSEKKVSLASTTVSCKICAADHPTYRCEELMKLSIPDRVKLIKEKQLCTNCLNAGHYAKNCRASTCKKCSSRHNTILHEESNEKSKEAPVVTHCSQSPQEVETQHVVEVAAHSRDEETSVGIYYAKKSEARVILSTARIYVHGADGKKEICRALLDPGSQSNLVTEKLTKKLQLQCQSENRDICGISQTRTTVRKVTKLQISSIHNNFTATLDCLVLPSITEDLPQNKIDVKKIVLPKNIQLADPVFEEPASIDLLIGAALYWKIVLGTPRNRIEGQPALQNTELGWILGGELSETSPDTTSNCLAISNEKLSEQVERFWKQENFPEVRHYTNEERVCEKQFEETAQRDESGRFIVRLPIRENVKLGDSKDTAYRRFISMERRFEKNEDLKKSYVEFMDDYIQQGHMSLVQNNEKNGKEVYYLPHQAVVRPDSVTTKLRVVFDASAKTTSGKCLNDKLMTGPNLQREIINIILRFRTHEYVLTADVAAMFRQILIDERDRRLQRIFWRKNPGEPIKTFELNTVTYGTVCAPYLAMRCLRYVAEENIEEFPQAANAVLEDCYMDDVLTGTKRLEEAIELQKTLSQLLKRGQFHLRKWRSNDKRVLQHLSEECKADTMLTIDKEGALKTLGLLWDSTFDRLQYRIEISSSSIVTKRAILSKIAQVYDPLGLLAPILIIGKVIMQQLWLQDLEWDQSLPEELHTAWESYYTSLPKINDFHIPRNVTPSCNAETFDLIGFGDASEKAFGACLYAVSTDKEGRINSHLLCAKAKVAPLKSTSLPRLELEAALLLARLYTIVKNSFGDKIEKTSLWSDSTIVLGWVKLHPQRLKTFVANRVSKIQELTENIPWNHVSSEENPADLLSRGISVDALANNTLWWHGPPWLVSGHRQPENSNKPNEDLPELKSTKVTMKMSESNNVFTRFSSYGKLQRVIAYVFRFKYNCRKERKNGPLSAGELHHAEKTIIRKIQQESFKEELRDLQNDKKISNKSKLQGLDPFLDDDGLIRVGGRLRHSSLSTERKHPMILPAKHFITGLIIREEHCRLHHCPPEQLLSVVRCRFWPISGRREVRKVVRNCLHCFRFRPTGLDVKMGDLPKERVSAYARPFTCTGVDYAGPLQIRESKRRGRIHVSKGYVAVFTCLSTKAVHLELVSDLTTEAFLAALSRFTARRGICSEIFSDNGTNFVGASRELKEIYAFLEKEKTTIEENLAKQRIKWSFIPPRAPHFGGIWEAAVKITKRHLYTVTQGRVQTFEEYSTLLAEIEAILNSRPLTPLSNHPNDLEVLTPAHFLVGDLLVQPVENNYLQDADNQLTRWQLIRKLRQQFWSRWQSEYLQELQKRNKWTTDGKNIELNTLVLLKDDHLPPLQWLLGRVITLHPGQDGVVRVVSVKTKNGEFKRAVRKLCPIPLDEPTIN